MFGEEEAEEGWARRTCREAAGWGGHEWLEGTFIRLREEEGEVGGRAGLVAEDYGRRWGWGHFVVGQDGGGFLGLALFGGGLGRGAAEGEGGFGRVGEEVEEVGFADVGGDEDVVLLDGSDGLDTGCTISRLVSGGEQMLTIPSCGG